ncbi:hypothetical protein R5R35_009133 [Gryllus longicercus]
MRMSSLAENDVCGTRENESCQTRDGDPSVIQEGKAEILIPESKNVFYNPVQEFNRDLSIAALTVLAKEHFQKLEEKKIEEVSNKTEMSNEIGGEVHKDGIVIIEALSATGLRSIRYAKEISGVKQVIANDISETAVKSIKENVTFNEVDSLVTVSHDDAVMLMYAHRHPSKRVHAVDLDPYGCPTQFLDAAVQCVTDGGLLLVTCTDMAVLAGNAPETCHAKYGAISLRTKACHEMGLRIILQCIETHANRYGRYIVPMLSVSADFYIRVFVKIYSGAAMCKRSTSKLSLVFQCVGCETHVFHPLGVAHKFGEKVNQYKFSLPHAPVNGVCEHCGQKFHIGGPIWNGPLHDESFVSELISITDPERFRTARRMEGVLTVIQEELPDVPLYYSVDKLFSTIRCEIMSMMLFRSALLNAGYRVSLSHASKYSIKTDAPANVVWDVVRTWQLSHPVKTERLSNAGSAILAKSPTTVVSLEKHPDANPNSRQMGLVRFQENPRPFWGPGTRAKTNFQDQKMEKSIRNQGKHSKKQRKRSRSHSKSPEIRKKNMTENISNSSDNNNLSEKDTEMKEDK